LAYVNPAGGGLGVAAKAVISIAPFKFTEGLAIEDRLPGVAEEQKVNKKVLRQAITQKLEEE
jgi:hypothetical protein